MWPRPPPFRALARHCHSPIGLRPFPRLSYTYHEIGLPYALLGHTPRAQNNQTPAYLAGHSPDTTAKIFREHNQKPDTARPDRPSLPFHQPLLAARLSKKPFKMRAVAPQMRWSPYL